MTALRRSFILSSLTLLLAIALVACSQPGTPSATTTQSGSTNPMQTTKGSYYPTAPAPRPKATPTIQPMPGYGSGTTPTPAATTTTSGNGDTAFIHTAVVTLSSNKVHVLTTNKGFMLYYYKNDMMLTSNCTGGCAQAWPPLLAPQGMMTVTSSGTLPKMLSVHKTANGQQVFYDGHALYTYAGDMQPGQFTGRGMSSVWYLVGIQL